MTNFTTKLVQHAKLKEVSKVQDHQISSPYAKLEEINRLS